MEAINEDLVSKLKYIKLDLEDIPDCLNEFNALNFNVSRLNNDKDHRVFKFIPIDRIEILLTPCLRGDTLKEKYSKAVPLYKFLNPGTEPEEIERYTTFLKILSTISVPDIENIISTQKNLEKNEPFKVKFARDNLWQIYYSESTDRYFMLVCTKETTFAEFFYLLKKKIEFASKKTKIVPKIYVPINSQNYSEQLLNRNEISDLENYLWLFTKNWCLVFEVYNKSKELSLQIVGDTFVYDKVKSTYKVKLTNEEDAIKFYKLMKALFIMQTEIKDHFNFTTKIDSKNNLELYMGKTRMTYDMLADFIKSEFKIAEEEIRVQNKQIVEQEEMLEDLKDSVKDKEEEYLAKQREISTYLECKKTFFGKVKYFFKSSKTSSKSKDNVEENSKNRKIETQQINVEPIKTQIEDKEYYTIEDLVTIYSLLEKCERSFKNVAQDIAAQKLRLENLESKVKNANIYIEEIDKHRRSIFDFWKFANKDEKLSLEVGSENSKTERTSNLKRVFDVEMDLEEFGKQMDILQRKKLSNEEAESVFIANTELLYLLNMLRENDMNKVALENALEELKEEFNKNRLYIDSETFDIFGNVEDDSRKIKYIGSRSHRENEKNKYKILNINKKIDVFDFTEKLQGTLNYIEGAIPKITSSYDMSLYKVVQITEKVKERSIDVYDMNIERALQEYDENGEGALNLIKLNYKENMPILYYSNIMFYDNQNKTLPEGMDLSTRVLIDCNRLDFKLIGKNKFRTNNYFAEQNNLIQPKSKDIFVYEYDVTLKEEQKEENEINEEKDDEVQNNEE